MSNAQEQKFYENRKQCAWSTELNPNEFRCDAGTKFHDECSYENCPIMREVVYGTK